jgi:hypothetical protein
MRITALDISLGGSFDLSDDDLLIDYTGATPAASVRAMLIDGRLNSSLSTALTGLGYADNTQSGLTVFSGQPVDPTSILIKYTYLGDADLDGDVDVADLGKLASSWQSSGVWFNGDFDYSGSVDINDLGLLASNWQAGVGSPLAPAAGPGALDFGDALQSWGLPIIAVPEASIVAPGIVMLLALRRRPIP